MSQWGKIKKIDKMVFMPHVNTGTFDPILSDSKIEDVFLMNNGGSQKLAEQKLKDLKEQYIGEFYNTW